MFRAWTENKAHNEKNYSFSGFHIDLPKRKQSSTVERSVQERGTARDDKGDRVLCC